MQPKSQRRVHGAEFKAQVLQECRQPGASVAAVALAHGLNVNLVRKWLVGRGLKRTGLLAPRPVTAAAPAMQFVPVELAEVVATRSPVDGEGSLKRPVASELSIHVELRRGGTQLTVRWPSSQASSCATWLAELAGTALR
jgi:transposase